MNRKRQTPGAAGEPVMTPERLRQGPIELSPAVIADSVMLIVLLPRNCSMCGAPTNTHKKQGVNVTHVVIKAPSVAATIGLSVPGCVQPPIKPTNCRTIISGPGVVSANPSPSIICPGFSQPKV